MATLVVLVVVVVGATLMDVWMRRRSARFSAERIARWETFQKKQGMGKS